MPLSSKIISIFFLYFIISGITPYKASAQGNVSFQVFYDELSPYGTWVETPQYGYVWFPNEGPGFVPYSSQGYWTLTDYGWTWVSYYPWGWAPFHYGRWYDDPIYGPMWVPDNEWGPGWVSWRRSNDYYGWTPIGPGVSLSLAYSNGYDVPYNHWTFVRNRDFGRRNSHNYYVNSSRKGEIYKGSSAFNNERIDKGHNVRYNQGPDRKEVEKHWGRPVNQLAVKDINKPGQKLSKNQYQIYRPQIQKENALGSKPVPAKVSNMKDIKPPAQRVSKNTIAKPNLNAKQPSSKIQQNGQRTKQKLGQDQPSKPNIKTQRIDQTPKNHAGNNIKTDKQKQGMTQPVKQQPIHSVEPNKHHQQKVDQPSKPQMQRSNQPMKQPEQNMPQNKKNTSQRIDQSVRQQPQRTPQQIKQPQQRSEQSIRQQQPQTNQAQRQQSQAPPQPARQQPPNDKHQKDQK